jgi:hypothetical protein
MSEFCWLTLAVLFYVGSAHQAEGNPLLCPSSLEVLMLFTILGLNTIILDILSSKYHHLIICSQQFLQQWQKQQEQHNKLKSTTKIMVPITDNNDIFFCALYLPFHSHSSTSFCTFSTLWFAKCKPISWARMLFTGVYNCISPKRRASTVISQKSCVRFNGWLIPLFVLLTEWTVRDLIITVPITCASRQKCQHTTACNFYICGFLSYT